MVQPIMGEKGEKRRMISVRDLKKVYDSFTALQSVDLEIEDGEFIAILGPSGCGKTTLLKLMAGFMKPTSGEVIIDDALVASPRQLTPPEERNIGMVFQSFALWPHMTVREHVMFPLLHHRFTAKDLKKNMRERVETVLELVGLKQLAGRYPAELSGGQKQRVALARAVAALPRLLLMDEPLSALDVELRMEMRREIQRIHRKTQSTIVYVTHDQSEALAMADRIVVMNEGRIEQVGTPEAVYTKPETEFVAAFVGKCQLMKGTWEEGVFIPEKLPLERWKDHGVSVKLKKKGFYPVRPEQWRLAPGGERGEGGIVTLVQYQGKEIHYTIQVENEEWEVHDSVYSPRFYVGDEVSLSLRSFAETREAALV
ncbi:ABC transporter ATP-binding protein [Bacillus thermotolerans]|nr:ABC transporter ATP-binding protein [Bacillus thermotolerans]